jgi:ribonuclease III
LKPAVRELLRGLGHEFQDRELLQQALTHRSVGGHNNERLEFLGDAILGFVIAEALFRHLPRAREGELSRMRASLVKRETLAEVARGLKLGDHLQLGSGELKSGGFRRDSTLADALEALFGAIYLDSDFATCRARILELFTPRLEALPSAAALKDPKTRLQEYLQGRRVSLPEYEVLETHGNEHDRRFLVLCRVAELDIQYEGSGNSRRRAEQAAAAGVLEKLGVAPAGDEP